MSLRLDGELSEFEQALLVAHLDSCASCAAFAVDATALTAELRAAPLERLGHRLTLPARVHTGLRRLHLGAAAAVLVTVVGAGSVLGTVRTSEGDRFGTLRSGGPPEPTLRELRANDLRPAATAPRGVKVLLPT